MPFIRVNGELAEIVPTVPGRAKLVYLACEPEDRLPTEIQYGEGEGGDRFGRGRLSLIEDGPILLVERVEPALAEALDARKLVLKLHTKFFLKRHRQRPPE